MYRSATVGLLALIAWPWWACCQEAGFQRPDEVVCPRTDGEPRLDGVLDDECWRVAAVAEGFTRPLSAESADKPVRAMLCFDDEALYIGVTCTEPHPERIKTGARDGSSDVWQDDCVEVFLRATDSSLELDQFILNAAGARQSVRVRLAGPGKWKPTWRGAAEIGEDAWTAEIVIPFTDLGMEAPAEGSMLPLKIGREDYTVEPTGLSTWPPRSGYGKGGEGWGRLYFGTANLLTNPDMSGQENGRVLSWSFHEDDAPLFSSAEDAGRQVIRWETPGRYSNASQTLQLRPNSFYRLEAWVRGTAGVYLRARTSEREGSESRPFTVNTRPSDDYVHYEVAFPTGEQGAALIIVGNTEGLGAGEVYLAGLAVAQEIGYEDAGPAIAITPGQTLYLTDVAVADCRALRGFVGGPVDGRLDSYRWDGGVWEYGMRNAGAGVFYDFNGGDGLHLKLADAGGVDAVQIRNGARVKLYRDCTSYYEPGDGELAWDFATGAKNSRALFEQRVVSDSFSFFDLTDGNIADLSFLRIEDNLQLPGPQTLTVTGPETPQDLMPFAEERFGEESRGFLKLAAGAPAQIAGEEGQFLHFVTEPMGEEMALLAVGVRLRLPDALPALPVSVRVQDPFNPRMELMGADLAAEGPGELHVILNHQDQIVPAASRIWVSVQLGADTTIEQAQVELYQGTREQALPEALAYRKLILKGVFCASSEARPWTGLRRPEDLDRIVKESMIGKQVGELFRCLEFCTQLGPADDVVREYHEWLWRGMGLEPYQPRIDEVAGAPEWAVVARQAWLEAREVPRWWIENRLTPTGELGGRIGDDSDMYQNYADFPMISDDGVAFLIKRAAADLAELAEATTLEAGLNRRTMDPLHAYEEGVNQEALMVLWNYGDPVYFERCMAAAKSLPALTVMTPKGHRHFKSQSCGAEDLRIDRPTDNDGHAHPLMLHPAFEVAWYNRHPRVIQFLREWADGWLEHQQPGEYATMVEVATEKVVESHPTRPLYGGYGGQASAFMFLYYVTGDGKYLRPFTEHYARGEAPYPSERRLYELYQAGALDDYSEHFERLAERSTMMKAVVSGDKAPIIEALKGDIAEMQRFRHMYTTAEQFTDRIFLSAISNAATCYTGGYATRNKYDHRHACSWEGLGTDFAALVLVARPDRFKALVYNFADEPLVGSLRLWTLRYCDYRVAMGPDADGDDEADAITQDFRKLLKRGESVPVTLPPKQVTVIELTQHQNPEPVLPEPDLALSPLDTVVEGDTVRGVVHNIGTGGHFAVVCLMNPAGDVVQRKELGEVPWPEDLEPVRVAYEFKGLPDDPAGWRVFVTGTEAVVEVYEGNNQVLLRR